MPDVPRVTLVGYALLALVVVAIGVRWMASRPDQSTPATPASSPPYSGSQSTGPTGRDGLAVSQAVSTETVHVTGAVKRPGVYHFGADARVQDAVRRAGGVREGANTAAVNLAAKLADGQQVVVPERAVVACAAGSAEAAPSGSAPPAASGAPDSSSAPVSLGAATLEQLDGLPGIGPATAQKILDWRTQNGGFSSVDDLAQVPGIGPKKLEALRAQVQP